MVLGGDPEYSLHFNPTDALSDAQRNYAEPRQKSMYSWPSTS